MLATSSDGDVCQCARGKLRAVRLEVHPYQRRCPLETAAFRSWAATLTGTETTLAVVCPYDSVSLKACANC